MFKNIFKQKLSNFALILGFINLILYHFPFYKFAYNNIETNTLNGVLLLISLTIMALFLNAVVFYIILYLLRRVGKWLLVILFNINAISVYFINTYHIIIDKSMIGNVLNTNYEESSAFFSIGLILYLLFLGIIPSIYILKTEIINSKFKTFILQTLVTLILLTGLAYANATNWLWVDKHSTELGALTMPWSYVVNTSRYYSDKYDKNREQIALPDATIKDDEKAVVVLVIGESARRGSFSLYGYEKNTNPLLSQIEDLHHYEAESDATYTRAGVKALLEHKKTSDLYEPLPNYLFRNGVDVYWRTTNWGEPQIKIDSYQKRKDLKEICEAEGYRYDYDEVLISGLRKQILASTKNKILVVLHTSTSHGPTYNKKYPSEFEKFSPVCTSVELTKCNQDELFNAYDNTIVYTDYLLATIIDELKQLKEYKTTMIFVSDHGESLGETNLYMHGLPKSIAPKEQYEIPFIAWSSENSRELKDYQEFSQHNVFHSVLDFLAIDSPIYNEEMSIFKQ